MFVGCSKFEKNLERKYDCDKLSGIHKFIYEPIVIAEDCNCIVSGKVKYLKNCKTIALIDFGNGVCDKIATKILCKNGNCFDKNKNPFNSHKFDIECNGNELNEGEVSSFEIEQLFSSSTGPQP